MTALVSQTTDDVTATFVDPNQSLVTISVSSKGKNCGHKLPEQLYGQSYNAHLSQQSKLS